MQFNLRSTCFAATLALVCGSVFAAPSSKFSAATSDKVLIESTAAADWTTVMTTGIKIPSNKDLFAQMAMECGLFTRTSVADNALTDANGNDTADSSSAEAVVKARVLVTDANGNTKQAHPGEITLCARSQQVTALFNGICRDQNDDGTVQYDECEENEELDLAIKTMNASAFNFILEDLTSGTYSVSVQARIDTRTQTCDRDLFGACIPGTEGDGYAEAKGMVGNGSLAVEEVRLVKGAAPAESGADVGTEEGDYFDYFFDFGL